MQERIQRIALPTGGSISFDLDKIPPPELGGNDTSERWRFSTGPVGCYYFGSAFCDRRCETVIGPFANSSTARLLTAKWISLHSDDWLISASGIQDNEEELPSLFWTEHGDLNAEGAPSA